MRRNTAVREIGAMIAGAQKAGTSSLAFYLGQHPEICTHERLELSYFVDDLDYAQGYPANFERYFAHCSPTALLLGKSVTAMTDPALVDRMHGHNAEMRLIVVLRNPVDRAYSAYWWARRKGYETIPTFEAALNADPQRHDGNVVKIRSTSYISFGEYAEQLACLFHRFGRSQVRVYLFEDLADRAVSVTQDAFAFLGVDPTFVPEVAVRKNRSSLPRSATVARLLSGQHPLKRWLRQVLPQGVAENWKRRAERWNRVPFRPPPMDDATRQSLASHFAPHNERLASLLGRDLSAWTSPQESRNTSSGD